MKFRCSVLLLFLCFSLFSEGDGSYSGSGERYIREIKCQANKKYPIAPGECIFVMVSGNGKESSELCFSACGKDGEKTENTKILIQNPSGKEFKKLYKFETFKTATAMFSLSLEPVGNSETSNRTISFRRLTPVENSLYSLAANRQLWKERTVGKNLLSGRKLSFSPPPDFPPTAKNGSDAYDLTDGKLSVVHGDDIWMDTTSVGWYGAGERIIFADLGAVHPVGKIVIRLCGGRTAEKGGRFFPDTLEAWIGKDGRNFYPAQKLKQVADTEKPDANWTTLYHLPSLDESAPAYVFPFELTVNADARYVVFRAKAEHFLLCDEMAVIEAKTRSENYNAPYGASSETLCHETMMIMPFYEKFYVPCDIQLPNWFRFDDGRTVKSPDAQISYTVDLPEQVSYTHDAVSWPQAIRTYSGLEKKNGRILYHFKPDCNYRKFISFVKMMPVPMVGPFYFKAENEVPEKEKYVVITSRIDGIETFSRRMTLEEITLPKMQRLKNLTLDSGSFDLTNLAGWPDIIDSFQRIGFNTVQIGIDNPAKLSRNLPFVKKIHSAGFNLSAFICSQSFMHFRAEKDGKSEEIRCTSWDRFGPFVRSHALCPAYRGQYYQEVQKLIADGVRELHPEYVSLDEEHWAFGQALDAFRQCEKCDALRKQLKMSWPEYYVYAQAEFLGNLAVAARKIWPAAQIGFYILSPEPSRAISTNEGSFRVLGYDRLFGRYADEVQPSYYGPNPEYAHKQTRYVARIVKEPKRIRCWRTVGTGAYGSDDMKENTTWELLETYMNGAGGIIYYSVYSFVSPIDYAYVSRGVKAIAPYDAFLSGATLDDRFTGSNQNMLYTLRVLNRDALLLIGNYKALKPQKTLLKIPGAETAKDCITGAEFPIVNGNFEVIVPGRGASLIYITGDLGQVGKKNSCPVTKIK